MRNTPNYFTKFPPHSFFSVIHMKSHNFLSQVALSVLFIGVALAPLSLRAQQPQSLRAEITYNDSRRQIGILLNANSEVISFALQEGAPAQNIAYTDLKGIVFPDSGQIMQSARQAYLSGDWENAAIAMEQVADAFPQAAYVPNSFATEARFYHMDSLRRLGRYSDIGRLFQTNTGKALEAALADIFDRQVAILKLWAFYGADNIEGLGAELENYLKSQLGDDKMLPDRMFTDGLPAVDVAQLSFLRAKVNEAGDRTAQALEDYYRAFTLTQANQSTLAKEAMEGAMAIHAADPELETKDSKKWPLQGVAFLYKTAFNHGEIDAAFADYAVMPELPVAPAAPKKEEAPAPEKTDAATEKPAPAEAAPAKKNKKAKAEGAEEPK